MRRKEFLTNTLRSVFMVTLSVSVISSLTGCNEFEPTQGLQASGELGVPVGGDGGGGMIDTNVGMEALNKDLDAMEASIANVEDELAKVDIPLLSANSSTNSSSQSLTKEMRAVFTKLYDSISLVYGKVGSIRQLVNERLAQLDPSNPLHFAALMKLREYMKYLDDLETRLADVVKGLASRVDDVVAKIEGKVAGMDMKNPLTWAVMFAWEQVKGVFFEFRDKLLALAAS